MKTAFSLLVGFALISTQAAAQGTPASVPTEIPLEYDPSNLTLNPRDPAQLPIVTNGDHVRFEVVAPSFPIVVRRLAYRFEYKTKIKRPRGGIAGLFGGKTSEITIHPVWIIVDVPARKLGEGGSIVLKVETPGEPPFLPSETMLTHEIEQIKQGGGRVRVIGSVTPSRDGLSDAQKKLKTAHLDPENGYDPVCTNPTAPLIAEAGAMVAPALTNPNSPFPAPSAIEFALKVSVKSSRP